MSTATLTPAPCAPASWAPASALTCQVNTGTLVVPCPNRATDETVVAAHPRRVCRAHR